MYGKNKAVTKNSIPAISAVFLSVDSIDFLLPYSFDHAAHPIHSHNHPFGLIRSTDTTKAIHVTIRATTNNVFMKIYVVGK
jgi:hypothetical protein